MSYRIALVLVLIFYSSLSDANSIADDDPRILIISPQLALPIGIKIWFNECGGEVTGLTSWNKNESFASLGIGHFLWHPFPSKDASFNSGFPHLLRYIESRGSVSMIPEWLRGNKGLYCPWRDRSEFLNAKNSYKMLSLRNFLQRTIPIQAEYMARNLQEILPKLFDSTPLEDRWLIHDKFYSLARTPSGIYALVDYLNFKGSGAGKTSLDNYNNGSGLLQVLRGMKFAPKEFSALQAYVWSAKRALNRRVEYAPSSQYYSYKLWLAGWFKRLNTYLEGDLNNTQIATVN